MTDTNTPQANKIVETGVVELANSSIEYYSQGKGEAVVLLPGGSLTAGYMAMLAEALAEAGYRAVRVNPRQAGNSTGSTADVTLHDFAGDVVGVIQSLGLGETNIAGHAFGNRVARTLAADHPEFVRNVILLAAGGKVAPKPPAQKALRTIFNPAASDSEYLAAMEYMVGDPANVKMAWDILKTCRAPEAAPIQAAAVQNTSLDDWWAPPGKANYLALQGDNDQAAPPENGELLKQELGERVTLVTFPGAGHLMLVTEPKKTANAIIAFLNTEAQAA